MSFKYPLATTTWDNAEYETMQKVIASGMFTMGAQVLAYEKAFAEYFGSQYAVMVNSGSSANLLMVAALFFTKNEALKLKAGDEVIVPAVSWSTTYHPLQQYDLKVKFVDIDLNTLNFDLNALASAITDKTRLIFAVNLLGNPNDFAAIKKLIGTRNIVLMEDNCESMGATFEGKQAGTFGVMGSFSSFFSHHISTMEGGMITTDDEELYHILLSIRAHGWTRNLPKHNKVTGVKSDDPFEESFKFVLPGYNVRPLELSGALVQDALANNPHVLIQQETGCSSWFGFSLIIRPGSALTRADLIGKLNAGGFECRPIVAGNFAKNEVVKYFNHEIHGQLSNADYLDTKGLFIGNHHYPLHEAIDDLKKTLSF